MKIGFLILILGIILFAQGPSAGQSVGGLAARIPGDANSNLGAQVRVTDPHKSPNINAETINEPVGDGAYVGNGGLLIGHNHNILQSGHFCASPDDNLITVLTLLTNRQAAELELITEKNKGICGNEEIMHQISDTIDTYRKALKGR